MNIRYRETLIISLSSPIIRDIYKYSKINSLNNPGFILNLFVVFYRQHITMSSELSKVDNYAIHCHLSQVHFFASMYTKNKVHRSSAL